MADCSCDFYSFDEKCPYAYAESDCEVITINNAKKIVDFEFVLFYQKLKEKNEDLCDDYLDMLVRQMGEIYSNSKRDIPEFILKEIC